MGFSNALYISCASGFLVNTLTTTVIISEKIIQITPIVGETLMPDFIAVPSEQLKPFTS